MSTSHDTTGAVIACPADAGEAALRLVFASLPEQVREPHVESILAKSLEQQLDGLFAYCPNGKIDAALYVEPQAGRVASFWGPSVVDESNADCTGALRALIDVGRRWATEKRIEIAQTLVPDEATSLTDLYRTAGFSICTRLDYLISDVREVVSSSGNDDLQLQRTLSNRDTLAAVIAETYRETHDCPELNGLRDMNNVLDGYAAAGDSGEQHWFLVCRDNQNLGVLLLAEHTAQDQAELVYMGVVPSARGSGLGRRLTQFAQRKTKELGHSRLILAVDSRNERAIDIYTRTGFTLWDRRTALLCPFVRS